MFKRRGICVTYSLFCESSKDLYVLVQSFACDCRAASWRFIPFL